MSGSIFFHNFSPKLNMNTSSGKYKIQAKSDELQKDCYFVLGAYKKKFNYFKFAQFSEKLREEFPYRFGLTINLTEEEKDLPIGALEEFIKANQEEDFEITFNHYFHLYKLSRKWRTDRLTQILVEFEKEKLNDISTISLQLSKHDDLTDISHLENLLCHRIDQCFDNNEFKQLPIDIIMEILCQCVDKSLTFPINSLCEYINESFAERSKLLIFINIAELDEIHETMLLDNLSKTHDSKNSCDSSLVQFPFEYVLKLKQSIKELTQKNLEISQKHEEYNKVISFLIWFDFLLI
ncbi:hypothetical protein TRFO_08954 [Tritrichomonas foetus]|uniref:BTB domain-containing protein n=1 Tax=Tritrichomonas foetus TaxID=1144522 RepID=A0A1J4JI40_9EUKA|nr:hypothetical protein TRFO_08954 [Tritrichomonas foetus]|eukprot:OHS98361.1 hypothetical protein TRFO_08954 [Tritrichomonas foetus]